MNDLISRKALLKVPNVRKVTEYDETGTGMTYLAVPVEAIEQAPTINAVEVVRCKECRRGFADNSTMEGEVFCANWGLIFKADGFCHLAQKKDRPPIVFRKYKPFKLDEVVMAEIDWRKVGDPNIKAVAMAMRETMEKHKSSDSGSGAAFEEGQTRMREMKTPDVIKKGLASCSADECHGNHADCPYIGDIMCIRNICGDDIVYIRQLEKKCHQLERERDALWEYVHDRKDCASCKHGHLLPKCEEFDFFCEECDIERPCPCEPCGDEETFGCNWEWRGVKEDNK